MLSEIHRDMKKILALLDPKTDPPQGTRKKDPRKMYGGPTP